MVAEISIAAPPYLCIALGWGAVARTGELDAGVKSVQQNFIPAYASGIAFHGAAQVRPLIRRQC